jgi:hypothetical protein
MTDQIKTPEEEQLDAVVDTLAENTTTLLALQAQIAETSAAVNSARTYIQAVVKQTSWETNGKAIASVLTTSLERDHTALHAAAKAAQEMRGLSSELTRKMERAANDQINSSNKFDYATRELQSILDSHAQGKWRRLGVMVLIGGLCGVVGFLAREPAAKFDYLWDARTALKQDANDGDCKTLGGETLPSKDRLACVIWQDPS